MDSEMILNLVIKVQQFEDKRIEAKASWNIRELKGKLSEIYPTSTEEQKLIYSGKLLNDTVILKDVLREYEGQEAHTVHLVFTPKQNSRIQNKFQESKQNSSVNSINNQTSSSSSDMSTSELRQRHTATATVAPNNTTEQQQMTSSSNIPNNYFNAFYGNTMDANNILAQQYAMQTWMQQAYAQYMSQYMNIMSQSEQQANAQTTNFAFMQPPMPSIPTPTTVTPSTQSPNAETQAASATPVAEQQQAQQNQPAAEPQRRFPNIIQDEQENRDWLDILYSMSRLMILLCLVYFYSSPLRCLIVILIGVSIYLYHIYKQNQNRLNNNNTNRVNLNVNNNQPAAAAPQQPAPENNENPEQNNESQSNQSSLSESISESEPLVNEISQNEEPPVSMLTVLRTFVISFVASIIPEHPAI
ncbi:hypothetical protein PVAND_005928 [Polypedilum vanderplanki]|uniref:Ubiquitin-like domain-containing protein n=1 Tax=Polypedilum vanderplanki TaxID=319348 RepID=A0A9J6C235_POLVA|nr:hypothetical protein PVAND_005928 [Polypedilum vanderplanki]